VRTHPEAVSERRQFEDAEHYTRLGILDAPFHVSINADVRVPEYRPTSDVSRLRLADHGVPRALPRLFPFHFRGEVHRG